MNLMIPSLIIRNVLELLIDEYKNSEKSDFIDWNMEEGNDEEIID